MSFQSKELRGLRLRQREFFLTRRFSMGTLRVPTMNSRAFTLIELLIVVAIIAILAAIAVPNFLEAQIRAKVARVQSDMRAMATGIESYQVDHNKPPIRHKNYETNPDIDGVGYPPRADQKVFDVDNPDAAVGLRGITTPVAYLTSLPNDIFNDAVKPMIQPGNGQSQALDYWDPKQLWKMRKQINSTADDKKLVHEKGYALFSVGPDGIHGFPLASSTYPPIDPMLTNTERYFYDPTNGTRSLGSVYRFSQITHQGELYPIPHL